MPEIDTIETEKLDASKLSPRVFKLNNGDEIFGMMLPDSVKNATIFVKWPMKVQLIQHSGDGSASFGLCRWIPFTDQEYIAIAKASVVALADLGQESLEMYKRCICNIVETDEDIEVELETAEAEEEPMVIHGKKVYIN